MNTITKFFLLLLMLPASLSAQITWNWQNPLPQGQSLNGIHAFDANTALAVGNSSTVMKTTDGASWQFQHSVDGEVNSLEAVHFVDANTGWVSGQAGTILHTSDGGTSWAPQSSGSTQELTSVFFVNANTGWAVGTLGTVLHTVNGGVDWAPQNSGITSTLNQVFFANANAGWAVGTGGVIINTVDGGQNWGRQISNSTRSLQDLFFIDANNGWVVGSNGTILKTINGGATWEPQNILPNNTSSSSMHFINSNTGWISVSQTGSSAFILSTTNGGATWTTNALGINHAINGLQFVDGQTGWGVSNAGAIFKFAQSPTTVVDNSPARTPEGFTLLQNYPNPFNPTTAISFQLSVNSDIQLVIYNANGQFVRQLARGKFASGRHQVVWDGRDDHGRRVASGIYFYQLSAGGLRSTRGMILIK